MEEILKQLEKIDAQIIKRVDELLRSGKSKEIIIGIVNGEVEKMIAGLGVEKLADQYANNLLVSGLTAAKELVEISVKEALIQAVGQNVDVMANTYRDTILGYFNANTQKLKAELLNSLVNGVPTSKIAENLRNTVFRTSTETAHFLSDANINTIIQTSYSNVSRTATSVAFQDDKEQRFEYVGGVIPTSSKQCEWLMQNQDPNGYTMEQINAGIDTPFGIIDWNGRQPNYNCLHQFYPIDTKK